ncbi:MAG: hypothetical protein HOP19_10470 [Acidobacteria bacterium]|nr:hypothetical protein [Acidobacteriota bacterium]
MSTTSLFIELLITGVQAGLWIGLLVLTLLGFDWVNLERLKGFEAFLAALALAVIYPLGVLVDYLADELFRKWDLRLRVKHKIDSEQSVWPLLMRITNVALTAQLSYIRNRIRICRSSALNFGLLTLMGTALIGFRCRTKPGFPFWPALWLEILVGIGLTTLATLAWHRLTRSFYKLVNHGLEDKAAAARQSFS